MAIVLYMYVNQNITMLSQILSGYILDIINAPKSSYIYIKLSPGPSIGFVQATASS